MRPVTGAIVAALAGLAATPATTPQAMAGRCAEAVGRQLQVWGAVPPPRVEPGATMRHWPTGQLGTWVTEVRAEATVALLRVTPSQSTRLEWSDTCAVRAEDWPRPAAAAPRFSDADLTTLVSSGRPGVLYVWSPHMPLSVDGYQALAAAATARGLAVHAMLEPGADRAFAQASLDRGGLPREALRVADSVELWHRDVHLHTPVILAYARGRIAGDAWPGYHSAEEYGHFLDRALAGR
jgi:hypothetical protein